MGLRVNLKLFRPSFISERHCEGASPEAIQYLYNEIASLRSQ